VADVNGSTVAAILTGLAAVGTAWAAVVRAKRKGAEECEEALRLCRADAEAAQAEVYRLHMAHPEEIPPPREEPPTEEVTPEHDDGQPAG
jgi:hypothetical protein